MKCPQAKNSCNPNDYAMKITTEKLPDRQINLDWMKSKTADRLENCFIGCCIVASAVASWLMILWLCIS
jgi:hypothetical protein